MKGPPERIPCCPESAFDTQRVTEHRVSKAQIESTEGGAQRSVGFSGHLQHLIYTRYCMGCLMQCGDGFLLLGQAQTCKPSKVQGLCTHERFLSSRSGIKRGLLAINKPIRFARDKFCAEKAVALSVQCAGLPAMQSLYVCRLWSLKPHR